jgi:hypothetical protein
VARRCQDKEGCTERWEEEEEEEEEGREGLGVREDLHNKEEEEEGWREGMLRIWYQMASMGSTPVFITQGPGWFTLAWEGGEEGGEGRRRAREEEGGGEEGGWWEGWGRSRR